MTTLFSFDPGLRGTGVAVFENKVLVACAYVRSPNKKDRGARAWKDMGWAAHTWYHKTMDGWSPDAVAHEQMQVYRASLQKGDPNDLLELAGVCGWVAALVGTDCKVTPYLPRQWKGQIPKDVHAKRILGRLNPNEAQVLKAEKIPKSLEHNVIDAIGIGLYHLKRV